MSCLPAGLPIPLAEDDGLDASYWLATREHRLEVQYCDRCGHYQWGPEWICHNCLAPEPGWRQVAGKGHIYSWQRVWHPVHSSLKDHGPYVILLVELPDAGGIRMIGNLIGNPMQEVPFGAPVEAVFEDHEREGHAFTLVQWRLTNGSERCPSSEHLEPLGS